MIKQLARLFARLSRDQRGNVLMLTGLSIIPLVTAAGVGIDYSRAARVQTKLNAAADAAALSAVSQAMMPKTDAEAKSLAEFVFMQQVQSMKNVEWDSSMLTVTISHTGTLNSDRNAVVTYTARSQNAFANIVGMRTITIGGSSKANATRAPNIDFYMLLDTSPSMALPASSAGLTQMYNKTGCAFACHQTDMGFAPSTEKEGWIKTGETCTGSGSKKVCTDIRVSYYTWAKQQGIPVRIDLVSTGVEDLVDVAKTTAAENSATYRMALAQFDIAHKNIISSPGSLDTAKTKVSDAKMLVYCRNNQRVCDVGDNDTATRSNLAFDEELKVLPTSAGNGTSTNGDTPQAILFIITDGARDESRPGGKPEGPFDNAKCTLVKNRGVRIAILYTEYLKESLRASDAGTANWVNSNFRPRIDPDDTLATGLLNCASPGLFYTVSTDGDISASLAALFRQAVATAHLVQ